MTPPRASPPSARTAGPIAGGTVVTVSGTGFADSIATTGVTFAGNNATSYTINSDTSITATSPAHAAGVADVVVTNETGSSSTSSADHFSYEALPSVTGISPAAGTTNGGDVVTITGTGFVVGSTTVAFGAGAGTSVSCASTTSCSATSPAGSAGVVDLTVTTAGGTSTISSADHFTYDATPSVTAVSPAAGPIAGGTVVTVTGTGFADSIATTGVTFAGNNATSYTINSDTSITATSPAHAAGVADVVVTNETGSSSTSSADHFSYEAVPSVTGISPAAGTTNGGDVVTITGTGFVVGSTTVAFGAGAGTSVTCTSTTSCSATSPAGSAGVVDLTVTTAGGTSTISSADHFTYDATPSVTAVSPAAGPIAGGTVVTVSGTGFADSIATTGVTFAGNNATSYTINSDTSITATSPAHAAGVADVVVTNETGSSSTSSADHFSYEAVPSVTGISPAAGTTNGGDVVTISGTGFVVGSTTVAFGASAGTSVTCASTTSCSATSPAGSAGVVDLTVTTAGGTSTISSADHFTYDATPSVTAVSPAAGPIAGGTVVTITGSNFTGASVVDFGSNPATAYTVNSATQITATSPAGSASMVDITVTTPSGTSATSSADQYTYEGGPSLTALSPVAGPPSGGTTVTITGSNFTGASAVDFGPSPASAYTVNSATQITATSPTESASTVHVVITTPVGTSALGVADEFSFESVPTVTTVTPAAGPLTGGTSVTITGTAFTGVTGVDFGSVPATSYSVTSSTEIAATAPAGASGTADVEVTNSAGTSATSRADQFNYESTPTISAVSPLVGPPSGGTSVTITGTEFTGATAVDFGSVSATSYVVDSATTMVVTSPPSSAGPVDVAVTNAVATSTASVSDEFTYELAPIVTAFEPDSRPGWRRNERDDHR